MEDKNYVLVAYYYDDNNEFCYSISPKRNRKMYIKFKTKEFATEFVNTVKKNKERSFDFREFGTWEFNCADEKENGVTITYKNKKTNYFLLALGRAGRNGRNGSADNSLFFWFCCGFDNKFCWGFLYSSYIYYISFLY